MSVPCFVVLWNLWNMLLGKQIADHNPSYRFEFLDLFDSKASSTVFRNIPLIIHRGDAGFPVPITQLSELTVYFMIRLIWKLWSSINTIKLTTKQHVLLPTFELNYNINEARVGTLSFWFCDSLVHMCKRLRLDLILSICNYIFEILSSSCLFQFTPMSVFENWRYQSSPRASYGTNRFSVN